MEDKKLHPVTELLLARMKSHPEEFKDQYLLSELKPVNGYERWDSALRAIMNTGSDTDKEAIEEGLRPIRMKQIHEWVMDELCNGEERRRKAREAREEEERRYYAQQQAYAQHQNYAQTALGAQSAYAPVGANLQGILNQPTWKSGAFYEVPAPVNPGLVAKMKKALGI